LKKFKGAKKKSGDETNFLIWKTPPPPRYLHKRYSLKAEKPRWGKPLSKRMGRVRDGLGNLKGGGVQRTAKAGNRGKRQNVSLHKTGGTPPRATGYGGVLP